jgi:hypothetical protein
MKAITLYVSMLLIAISSVASADIPNPCCSTSLDATQRLLLIPDNDGTNPSAFGAFTVTVRNDGCVAIPNAIVEVTLGGGDRTRLCGTAVYTQVTDAHGVATFNIAGGGCYKGPNAVMIRANGVMIRNFQIAMSPDYAGYDNAGIPSRWDLAVTVLDFASFAMAVHNGDSTCHDYDNNGVTGATDVSVFGQLWNGGLRRCSP